MTSEAIRINLNLSGPQGNFFRRLQHQLDVTKVLQVGCNVVTAEQVGNEPAFGSFVPADGAQLGHDAARSAAQSWLLSGFLRDAIESAGFFLDECLYVCALIQLAGEGKVNTARLNHMMRKGDSAYQRLSFPEKIDRLSRDYGIATPFDLHVRSLNRARRCVVHRLGLVMPTDADDGVLQVVFQRAEFVATGLESGAELILDRSGITLPEASSVGLRFVDHVRVFVLGEQLRFEARELYDTTITMYRYGIALTQSIEAFAKAAGIPAGDAGA